MARLGSSALAYGHNHHDEHVAAAKLGWARRRGTRAVNEQQARWLRHSVGDVEGAHEHTSHRGLIAFKQRGKWYELPRAEFHALVRAGRDIEREQRHQEQDRARHQAAEARAIAEYQKAEEQERRQAERHARREERYKEAIRAQLRKRDKAERAEVVKLLRAVGGVRLATKSDHGEYALLPSEVRRKNGRVTMDEARGRIMEHMPWLNLETPDDLVNYFERTRVKTMHERYNATARRRHNAA